MPLKLGYNTNGFAYHRLEDAIEILAELGYRSIALTLDYHALNPYGPTLADDIRRTREQLTRLNLSCVIETGARFLLDPRRRHWPTLISEKQEDRARRIDYLRRAVDVAAALHAEAVSFWSGARETDGPEESAWKWLIDGCREVAAYAEQNKTRVAFEPEPAMLVETMAQFERLSDGVNHPAFGLTLDVGHVHCLQDGWVADHVQRWKDRLWNVHVEDMRHGIHDHLMFGEGEIDFPPLLADLAAIGYTGGVHVELSRHSRDAVNTAKRSFAFLTDAAK